MSGISVKLVVCSLKGTALFTKTTAFIQKNITVIRNVIRMLFLASLVNKLDTDLVVIMTIRSMPMQIIIHELTCRVKYEWNEKIRQIKGPRN